MPGLILKLRAHEEILVNGVLMQNGERNARLIVRTPDARILRLRDALRPEEATTPVRRECHLAQLAVSGELAPEDAAARLDAALAELPGALPGDPADDLAEARKSLAARNFYVVWRILRRLVAVEDVPLGATAPADTG